MLKTCREDIQRTMQGETVILAEGQSIKLLSGAVSGALSCYDRWTLYIATSGANNITFNLSPDNQTHWISSSDSPLNFPAAGSGVYEMGYDATHIRIRGNSGTGVSAFIRGCWG